MSVSYLFDPVKQFVSRNGIPLVGGFLNVFVGESQEHAETYRDAEGTVLNPRNIPLDSVGRAPGVFVDDSKIYTLKAYNVGRQLQFSIYPITPGKAGGGASDLEITSSDGTVVVTREGDNVDLSVSEPVPSAIVAESESRITNGEFAFTADPINIVGEDIYIGDSKIKCKKRWYHYDATVKIYWDGTPINKVIELTVSGPDCSERVSFDLSFPHSEYVSLSADYQIQNTGDPISLGISGIDLDRFELDGLSAKVTNASVHTIVGRVQESGGGIEYEAGDGITIDENDVISIDFDRAQEKLTAGENITIDSDGVISSSGIGDAPFDETTYARKDGEWVEISGVADTERTNWNAAYSHSNTEGNPHGTTIEDINGLRSELNGIESDVTDLSGQIESEVSERQDEDINLQSQIDAITSKSDVVDVVGTYAELIAYDTSTLGDNDVIKVLEDETQDDAESYYRWNLTTQTWGYIGSQGPFVTPAEMQMALNDKVDKVTGKGLSTNDFTNSAKAITDNIFLATYNSTSYADIKAAYDAGKTILCRFTDSSHTVRVATFDRLTNSTTSTSYAYFASVTKADAYELVASKSRYGTTTTWSNTSKTWGSLAEKSNVTNADISGTIQDAHIASASTWNGKQDAIGDLSTIRSNASNGQTAYGWGDHSTWKPTFSQASSRANLNGSGETIATIFGKIKKWFADLKTVAFTGSYNDLTNKPTIPPAITVDSSMSSTSTNPVQNKVIKSVTDALSTRIDNIPVYDGVPVIEIENGNTLPRNTQDYIYKHTLPLTTEFYTFIKEDESGDTGRIYVQKMYADVDSLGTNGVHTEYIEYNKSTRVITSFQLSTVECFMYRKTLYITKDWSAGSSAFYELDEVRRAYENHIPCILHARIGVRNTSEIIEENFILTRFTQFMGEDTPLFTATLSSNIDGHAVMYVLYLNDGVPTCYMQVLLDSATLPIGTNNIANSAVTRGKIAFGAVSTAEEACGYFDWTIDSQYNGGSRNCIDLSGDNGGSTTDVSTNSFNTALANNSASVRFSDVMIRFNVTYSAAVPYVYCNVASIPKFTLFRVKAVAVGNPIKIRFRTNSTTDALAAAYVNNTVVYNTNKDYELDANAKEDIVLFRGNDNGDKCRLYLLSTWTT